MTKCPYKWRENDRYTHYRTRNDSQFGEQAVMPLSDGNDTTTQELALKCICAMALQLDADFAQEVVDAGGIPHLMKAMLSRDAELAHDAREALKNIYEKLPEMGASCV